MNPSLQALEFFCAGALFGADQTAGPQWMLSQPLVAAAVGGVLTGQPLPALLIGVWAQLTWNGAAPVGSKPHPDGSTGALSGVWVASRLVPAESLLRASVAGIATALVVGWLATGPIVLNRRWNSRWTGWALAGGDDAEVLRRAGRAQVRAWLCTAGMAGAMVLAGSLAGVRLCPALLRFVPSGGGAGGALAALLWGLGLGSAGSAFLRGGRTDWLWLTAGAALAAGLKLGGAF